MAKRPFFSITIPTFNRVDKLKLAITRILGQTFKNFEIVISDNCSTDATKKMVLSIKDKRIKYFRNRAHTEVMLNVKRSIERSRGKYIFLQGDDDFLIEKDSLKKIHKIISETNAGYLRANYLSLSPDGKHIFDFRRSKGYYKDVRLKSQEKNAKIIDFLIKSDCSFIGGIIIKNLLPGSVSIIESELYSWFPIIFYLSQKYGAYYINEPLLIAGWSQWRARSDNFNPLYSLRDRKLTSEEYFNFVESKLNKREFKKFIETSLTGIYVNAFLAIKFFTGNRNMLQLATRLRYLSPDLKYKISFWVKLSIAYIFPRFVLSIMRNYYLSSYIRHSNKDNKYKVKEILGNNA